MIYILQHSNKELDKITRSKRAVLTALIDNCSLIGVIEAGSEVVDTLTTMLEEAPRGGWAKHTDIIDKFLTHSVKSLPITVAEYNDKIIISFTNKRNFKYKMLNHVEYELPIDIINKLFKSISKFYIKGNLFEKSQEIEQILADLEQFKTGRVPCGRVN